MGVGERRGATRNDGEPRPCPGRAVSPSARVGGETSIISGRSRCEKAYASETAFIIITFCLFTTRRTEQRTPITVKKKILKKTKSGDKHGGRATEFHEAAVEDPFPPPRLINRRRRRRRPCAAALSAISEQPAGNDYVGPSVKTERPLLSCTRTYYAQ